MLHDLAAAGTRIACIVATMGTTDAFGLDDLAGIVKLRDELVAGARPRLRAAHPRRRRHRLGVERVQRLRLRRTTRSASATAPCARIAGTARRIRHLGLADSIGIDFHKTGFAPYISSAVLVRDGRDFDRLARSDEDTPYIFQSGEWHPGQYTLETTRPGNGILAALANLRLFGQHGLQALLGHLVTMAEALREHLEGHASTTVLNGDNFGPVTLFRVYPDGVDTFSMPQQERTDPAHARRRCARTTPTTGASSSASSPTRCRAAASSSR